MTSDPSPPSVPPLFSPLQIAIASVIGGPIAACWFFARNYRALDQPRQARFALAWGIGGTFALGVLSYFLPENFPRPAIPIGYTFGLYHTAHQIHGELVREQISQRGAPAPWSAVIVFSVAILALLLALLLGLGALTAQT